jgi:cyanophycin synthetase
LDNARSPLCKINIDEDLMEFLKLQSRSLNDVPKEGERVELRRVANISAGGVSINVTDKIHPDNKKLVQDIAKYFTVTCLGIDVLAKDISQSWREGDFGIIEINAGPGVFMHLAPAIGGSVDVPGMIMRTHFPQKRSERIPIITGNKLSLECCQSVYQKLKEIKEDIQFGSLTDEGIYFNGEYFHKNSEHDKNVKIILRDPTLEFAMFTHTKDHIFDYGIWHEGADIVILEEPHYAEESLLEKQMLSDGYLIFITKNKIKVYQGNELTETHALVETEATEATDESETGEEQTEVIKDKQEMLLSVIEPLLKELVNKYE